MRSAWRNRHSTGRARKDLRAHGTGAAHLPAGKAALGQSFSTCLRRSGRGSNVARLGTRQALDLATARSVEPERPTSRRIRLISAGHVETVVGLGAVLDRLLFEPCPQDQRIGSCPGQMLSQNQPGSQRESRTRQITGVRPAVRASSIRNAFKCHSSATCRIAQVNRFFQDRPIARDACPDRILARARARVVAARPVYHNDQRCRNARSQTNLGSDEVCAMRAVSFRSKTGRSMIQRRIACHRADRFVITGGASAGCRFRREMRFDLGVASRLYPSISTRSTGESRASRSSRDGSGAPRSSCISATRAPEASSTSEAPADHGGGSCPCPPDPHQRRDARV